MTEPPNNYLRKFPPAQLTESQVEELQKLEQELTEKAGSPILLMAFKAEN
ncbi:hypothetical protein [Effusibacillus lacus]|uniref:Uncharacterized protein n=1 Tax=Effusibacillus lacus TaxID=1348429 RepID=A0A292YPJ6_9BACL|nr:hypothetical protein [Effusibacillus lacus]TCS76324.1 hypothetical protein EDD64_10390 [Effusibacillus lacus]GAX91868.1 hypothetical protein EFBL_3559 [Effusibacillus lacus]